MSLAKDFFFKVGFPPCVYNFELKNKLTSPVRTSFTPDLYQTLPAVQTNGSIL